jgi:hypothetical protein
MKLSIALSALLVTGFMAASTEQAPAVVDCQYVSYPTGVGARGVGVRRGTPMNRGGPVNRVGRR